METIQIEPSEVKLTNQNQSEILRYLGYRGQSIDERLLQQIKECIECINDIAQPKFLVQSFECMDGNQYPPPIDFLVGEKIKEHLHGCHQVVLMVATLGATIERQQRKMQLKDMAYGVIFDVCGSVMVEQLCDVIEEKVRKQCEQAHQFLTTRFSPGYGDLPLEVQGDFLRVMDAARQIGLTVSESGIMIPRKSVSAVMGISSNNVKIKQGGCLECNLRDSCEFRKTGVKCER